MTQHMPRHWRHAAYAVTLALLAMVTEYTGVLPVFRSHLQTYLNIGDARFGLLFSVGSIAGVAGILLGGFMIDRYGARPMIRVCLIGAAGGMFVLAATGRWFAGFVIAVTILGVSRRPLWVAVNAYLAKLFPSHERRVISLNLVSTSTGGMVFPAAAEGLLYLSKSRSIPFGEVLHGPFLIVGVVLLGGSLVYRRRWTGPWVRPGGKSSRKTGWQWRDLMVPRPVLFLAGLITLHGTCDATLCIWMPRFLESLSTEAPRIPPGLVLSGYSLAYLLSRLGVALLPDHVGRRVFMVLPGLLGGTVITLAALSRNYALTAGGYILAAFIWSAEFPAFVSTVLRLAKRRFGAAMAVSGVLSGCTLFLAQNGMGQMAEYLGEAQMWKVMLAPAVGFILVGLGGLAWTLKYGHGESPDL